MTTRKSLDSALTYVSEAANEAASQREKALALIARGDVDEPIKLVNPSDPLYAALDAANALASRLEYTRTCHSDTCACASHDRGYESCMIYSLKARAAGVAWIEYPGCAAGFGCANMVHLDAEDVLNRAVAAAMPSARDLWGCPQGEWSPEADLLYAALGVARELSDAEARDADPAAIVRGTWLKKRDESHAARVAARAAWHARLIVAGVPREAASYIAAPVRDASWRRELAPAGWAQLLELPPRVLERAHRCHSRRALDRVLGDEIASAMADYSHPRLSYFCEVAAGASRRLGNVRHFGAHVRLFV